MYRNLKIEHREHVELLAISAPESLNALNSHLLEELDDYLNNLESRIENGEASAPRCLIVTGDGDKAFVAGADISEMASLDATGGMQFGRKGAAVMLRLERLRCPTIAAVNGFALGGGCELALACDLRLCSDNAKFGQPEVGLGITPGFSGTYRLAKIVGGGHAKELIFTGRAIRADEAWRIGLVNAVVPRAELADKAWELAFSIAKQAPLAVQAAKRCIDREYDMEVEAAIAYENQEFGQCFATHDQKQGMAAFLAKTKFDFEGR